MEEFFIKEGRLVDEGWWNQIIDSMKIDFDLVETNKERSKRKLRQALIDSINSRKADKFGILISGGLDSSFLALIAKNLNCNFTCYSVGFQDSGLKKPEDLENSEKFAKHYGLKLKTRIVDYKETENTFKEVVNLLESSNPVKVGIGSVLYIACKLAKEDNVNVLFTGLGSDGIFCGFDKHAEILEREGFEGLHKGIWNGLKNMWDSDLIRDFKIAKELGMNLKTPFLDEKVVKIAMGVHPMFKLDKEQNKIILREIASEEGLLHEFAYRKKVASQYGSRIDSAMKKLAKKKGFDLKKDYLESLRKA